MIASRLLQVALDYVDDYNKMGVEALLQGASNLCTNRGSIPMPVFQQQSAQLRSKADEIIANTRFRSYPQSYNDYLNATPFASSLPAKVAQFVKSGLTSDIATTISSNEFNVIAQNARSALAEMLKLATILGRMNIERVKVPDNALSLDFLLPRSAFDNTVSEYLRYTDKINSMMMAMEEFCCAAKRGPELVFTSTTDPITAFGISVSAAYGIVQLINGLLDIAKKSIDLYSSIRRLKDGGVASMAAEMQTATEALTKKDVEQLVEQIFQTLQSEAPAERRNELRNIIAIHAIALLPVIADGATVSLSPESLERLDDMKPELIIAESPAFRQLQVDNGAKTRDLQTAVKLAGGRGLLRIEQSKPTEATSDASPTSIDSSGITPTGPT